MKNNSKLILIIVIVIVCFFVVFFGDRKKTDENVQNAIYNYDVETSIKEMAQVYYDNELNGNKTYFNKRVKLTGIIDDISYDKSVAFNTGISIIIHEDGAKYRVYCNFKDGDASGITDYKKDDTITIIGNVNEMLSNSLSLNKCVISK